MHKKIILKISAIVILSFVVYGCAVPKIVTKKENKDLPNKFTSQTDSNNSGKLKWSLFFKDSLLVQLIDSGLKNNQELNIIAQEVIISKNEVRARKGTYLPFLSIGGSSQIEKVGRYTSQGANDANTEIKPGKAFPDPLPDFRVSANLSWELDIWKKLRNSKKSAVARYLASIEGKNMLTTMLISEIANTYYELISLDNQLDILKQNIVIQQNALEIVKLEKSAARVTELAVRKFEAEVLKNQSRQFAIQQDIVEKENMINFLLRRFPQNVMRNKMSLTNIALDTIQSGLPIQLLDNRPDVRQAEQQLIASKLSVSVAKANFYPSLFVGARLGSNAFNPTLLTSSPQSLLYTLAGELVGPVFNRNAIKAEYLSANARQIQAVYNYERTILRGYIEVTNQLSNINNLSKSYVLKEKQVDALTQSIIISTGLFRSARADYMEVLLTQRDALEAKFELIETRKQQFIALVDIYRALGGGWR